MHRPAARVLIEAAAALFLTVLPLGAQEPERRAAEPIPIPPTGTPAETIDAVPTPEILEIDEIGPWIFEPMGIWGFTVDHYNRIDGLTPAWGFTLEPVDPLRRPVFTGRVGAATTHERISWSAALGQRLPLPGALVIRLEHFHRAATFDDWKVWSRENDVASFVAASDFLDWWREKGFEVALDAETPGGALSGTLAYLDAAQHAEPNRSPFALFGGDDDWRDNPAALEGRLRAVSLEGRFDTRDVQSPLLPTPGWAVRGSFETAGGVLGGDLDFARASLDVRRYTRLGRDAWWDSRLVWMGPIGDDRLPAQREVKLGGPGSLRGYRAASFAGDAGIQGQTELRLPLPVTDKIAILFLSWHWVAFLDAGTVAVEGTWEDVHADVGTGVSGINIFSYVGLFVAQRVTDLDGPDDGPRFVVRLRRDF